MAMKPSSKFERMKLKPSDRMKPMKKMVEAPGSGRQAATMGRAMPPAGDTGEKRIIMNKRPANSSMAAARRKAMQKMAGGYGK
jgi:hypothetical protein